MDFLASALRIAFGLLGTACFVLLTFTDLSFPVADSKTRRWAGGIWGLMFALFAVQLVVSGGDTPTLLTGFGVLGLLLAVAGFALYAFRPMVYLRPKGLTKVSKHEYRLEQDGIIIRTYGLGGPTTRRGDRPRFSIFNDGHQPLVLESATVRAAGRTYVPQLSQKATAASVILNPRASVPVKLCLDFDRPLSEAYGSEAQVVFSFRADSQSRQVSLDFEAERSAA